MKRWEVQEVCTVHRNPDTSKEKTYNINNKKNKKQSTLRNTETKKIKIM